MQNNDITTIRQARLQGREGLWQLTVAKRTLQRELRLRTPLRCHRVKRLMPKVAWQSHRS